jgi:Family of unknown function (DUF6879)
VTQLVRGERFEEFVLGFQRTAFRLETRERYHDAEEIEPLRRFLTGEPDYAWNEEWAAMIRRRTAEGQRMERVRIVSEPHSEYVRFLLDLARVNVASGEDIRYLSRHLAEDLDLPGHDFWMIDFIRVGILRFGADNVLLGAELTEDPEVVNQYRHYRDVALGHAIAFAEYGG